MLKRGRPGGQTAESGGGGGGGATTSPSVGKSFCRSFHTSQPAREGRSKEGRREGGRYRVPKRAISQGDPSDPCTGQVAGLKGF